MNPPRRRFLVCIHDVTPAHAREVEALIGGLAPLVGRRVCVGVVPNWKGQWPLLEHPGFCHLVRESSEEVLLHGHYHRRRRGWGPVSLLTGGADEMNGLAPGESVRVLGRGQAILAEAFGGPARGFLAPAWQSGTVRQANSRALGLDYVLGFFSVTPWAGRSVRLATSTWDCGRWSWLGYVGHEVGRVQRWLARGVPTLALHPEDLRRGFWPRILRLTSALLEDGYESTTVPALLAGTDA